MTLPDHASPPRSSDPRAAAGPLTEGRLPPGSLVVAAHPDDETIGAGALLARSPGCHVVHLTDGAPEDRTLWPASVRGPREAYAALRRSELERAVALAGVGPERLHGLGARDQEATLQLTRLVSALGALLVDLRPPVVVVHPYEGGHPDHDAAAFVAHRAAARVPGPAPLLIEMTSYHRRDGQLVSGAFLPGPPPEWTLELSAEEAARKVAMLRCFTSQVEGLAMFSAAGERFRPAPAYDFTRPPHAGTLHYETHGWPMTAARWTAFAREALGPF